MIPLPLPATLTPENLAIWIKENAIEQRVHTEKIELTPQQIAELEHKSSLASRAIDKLESQLKTIQEIFKKGTQDPYEVILYPTKGIETLKANRKYADETIENKFVEENYTLYGIPYPETKMIIYVDIEGKEFEQYRANMNPDQLIAYNTLFSADEQEIGDIKKDFKKSMDKAKLKVTSQPSDQGDLDFLDDPK